MVAERLSNQSQHVSGSQMTSSCTCKIFYFILFYFWLCLINLATLGGSWQQPCKVRFVHCSLSLMKWSVSGARKLGWPGLMRVSWWWRSRQPIHSFLCSDSPTPRLIAPRPLLRLNWIVMIHKEVLNVSVLIVRECGDGQDDLWGIHADSLV